VLVTRVLVLGVTGMLGNAVFNLFRADSRLEVWGTLRHTAGLRFFNVDHQPRLLSGVDVLDHDALVEAMSRVRPEVVINCVGIVKQLRVARDPLVILPINAMLPHRLARFCALANARLIHISTDCVFSGGRGGYKESDPADAMDLYGQSKFIGEVRDASYAVTLRSSIIGHELASNNGLVDWFLSQQGRIPGYARAMFSGLPTFELARVIRDFVLPRPELHGLYHVSSKPIAKYELLRLIAEVYGKQIDIVRDDSVVLDRSLNSERFTVATAYVAPEWPDLVRAMRTSRETQFRNVS
jgi:dTDP-4-dehydrorhamnose reductase